MSEISSNINASIIQAQVSASETARTEDAQRNKRTRDARELARLADQQKSEVEDTDHTEDVIVRRQDERQRNGQDARDTYEQHLQNESDTLYNSESEPDTSPSTTNSEIPPDDNESDPSDHIDLKA